MDAALASHPCRPVTNYVFGGSEGALFLSLVPDGKVLTVGPLFGYDLFGLRKSKLKYLLNSKNTKILS